MWRGCWIVSLFSDSWVCINHWKIINCRVTMLPQDITALSQRANTHSSHYTSIFVSLILSWHYCADTLKEGLLLYFTSDASCQTCNCSLPFDFRTFKGQISYKRCQVFVSQYKLFLIYVTQDEKCTTQVNENSSTDKWTSIHAIFFWIHHICELQWAK